MFCSKCGAEIKEGESFCSKCGNKVGKQIDLEEIKNVAAEKLQDGMSTIQEQTEAYQAKRKEELERESISQAEDVFVDSSEEQIAVLGGGYLSNFVHGGGLTKGFGIVTNKRFYFRGKCFQKVGGQYIRTNEEKSVDLPDITSSGFVYHQNILLMVLSIVMSVATVLLMGFGSYYINVSILFMALILTAIFWGFYFLSRKCIYEIQFAGGSIAVRASQYGIRETRKFDKEIRRAKDKAVNRG